MDSQTVKPVSAGLKQALRAAELILRLAQKKASSAENNAKNLRKKLKAAKKAARRAKKSARQARKQLEVARQACADIKSRIPAPARKTPSAGAVRKVRRPVPAQPRRRTGKSRMRAKPAGIPAATAPAQPSATALPSPESPAGAVAPT